VHIVIALLVDRVVGQVYELIALRVAGSVLLGGEPGETFFENVDAQRVDGRHANVDAEVELVSVDQQRVHDVARDDG